ncbi:BPL-N domain-containing protein [Gemmata sp. JC717]|uniref:BPL-N domain-containing protein n=1 Tax=Gemmata algarum TaxID=2975278 RepID=UPI0021BB45FB|nr:BPL-N domain-containing protein [Gemmata algarum]MDY3551526.1 BPL-N domain-containing protein [Gemmata algarum]
MPRSVVPFAALVAVVLSVSFAQSEPPAKGDKPVRVAVFAGGGAAKTKGPAAAAVEKTPGFEVTLVTGEDIRAGALKDVRVLIQPGGSGAAQAKDLGEEGRAKVKQFVKDGGGYIGICAGAYLASRSYDWSLHILDAEVLDRAHWARGTGDVELRFGPKGKEFFDTKAEKLTVYYGQGPLLAPGKDDAIPDYEELATYETEIFSKGGAKPGVMKGTTAAARGSYGTGRVFCWSPHPEKTDTPEAKALFRKALLWTAGKE